MGSSSEDASAAATLRQRKPGNKEGAAQGGEDAAAPPRPSLARTQSWHESARQHVMTRRRYSLLAGIFLGVTGFMVVRMVYLDQDMPDMIQIPSDSMRKIREKFNTEWTKRFNEDLLANFDYRPLSSDADDRPGLQLRAQNVTASSPVVLLPGFTSTGLEIWDGSDCAKEYFRQRIWGTARMLHQFMLNQKCWLEHMMLNRTTGLDPEGVRLRPAYGLEAADYVIGGYWVWGKIIENLADIGYDSNNMFMASYDWRLAPSLMEERDRYFTKLKYTIEMAHAANDGQKVVVISHSYAQQVLYFFLQWVESPRGGNGGPEWCDTYVEAWANIAGSTLGTVKSVSALLSGEMKDTAELGGLSRFLSYFFGPPARAALARSWPSVFTMLPIGGEAIWGTTESAPDDLASRFAVPQEDAEGDDVTFNASEIPSHLAAHGSNGGLLQIVNALEVAATTQATKYTAGTVHDFLGAVDANLTHFQAMIDGTHVTSGADATPADDPGHPRYWTNPLATTLPHAPKMKVFCLYGVGKPVERGYIYRANDDDDDVAMANGKPTVPFILNTDYNDPPWVKAGIRYTDGDGTVPLVSLGFMCARGWRSASYNPSGMEVRIREYKHNPVSLIYDPRGGPATSDHVDIMGNHDLIRDVLHITARAYDQVPEQISSDIHAIADRVQLPLQ